MNRTQKQVLDHLTCEEILEYLESRVHVMACGLIIPDDDQSGQTITYTSGNRCAVLGLSVLLKSKAKKSLTDYVEEDEKEDDDDEDSTTTNLD